MPLTNTNSRILLQAAKSLGITTQIFNLSEVKIKLTKGQKSHIVHKKGLNLNSRSAIRLTHNKTKTLTLLHRHGLPVPPSSNRFPLVVKPAFGQKGQHVYLNIQNQSQLDNILKIFQKLNLPILVQPFLEGHDLRFFVLNGQVIGITHRQPPQITGNGHSTIKQLIESENYHRVKLSQISGHRVLNRLRHWPRIRWYLTLQGTSLQDILPQEKTIEVYPLANFSTGGSAHALKPNQVHPSIIKLAQTAVKLTDLTVAGVDMIVKEWHKPATPNNAYIIEVNSDPSLRLHDWPNTGRPQHVAQKLLNFIFTS